MSSTSETAEERFRQAFERLRDGHPRLLPRGTVVSQNNVAREAGADPSALKKSRYPVLVREIQTWVEIHDQLREVKAERQRRRRERETLESKVKRLTMERDSAQSKLENAHRAVLELLQENALLRVQVDELQPPPTPLRR
ncbi:MULTISPECIES: hypothetical protein [Cupriavidus]|uniref:Uncharacterized protein n=1 Tax=Cupriavidus pauculus TaxID=82633 RepID=A0A3G8H1X5_9BURK|nr:MULTISPECIES: hypothetical protein [Cupriavidus]AZG14477.1 hypothetical protein EHF44_14100 [Cupriavidus pauculus]MBY4732168.1 hypothetical protein [Cupriavidus pauculus]